MIMMKNKRNEHDSQLLALEMKSRVKVNEKRARLNYQLSNND